jgi:hypothetical protein
MLVFSKSYTNLFRSQNFVLQKGQLDSEQTMPYPSCLHMNSVVELQESFTAYTSCDRWDLTSRAGNLHAKTTGHAISTLPAVWTQNCCSQMHIT